MQPVKTVRGSGEPSGRGGQSTRYPTASDAWHLTSTFRFLLTLPPRTSLTCLRLGLSQRSVSHAHTVAAFNAVTRPTYTAESFLLHIHICNQGPCHCIFWLLPRTIPNPHPFLHLDSGFVTSINVVVEFKHLFSLLHTPVQIAGKLASGPICAYLGARWIGLATLLVNAILFAAAYAGTEVAPFLWVFAASRFSQCFTWVCIPQILSEWFSKSRHGECFGYMSTASRTGIISTTALLYLAGADVASRNHFAVGAAVMLACFAFFSAVFPTSRGAGAPNSNSDSRCSSADAVAAPVSPSMPPTTEATTTSTSTESFYAIVKSAAANPIILMQFPVMMSATPLAEFQSQVPVMLKGDPALAPELVSFGTMLWHVGVRDSRLVISNFSFFLFVGHL